MTGIAGSGGTTTSFGYDGNGNQVRKTETPAGGAAQVTQYLYNEDNRLTGIALPNGGSNVFEYDANGLRTKKTDSGGTSSYLLDGLSVVAQYAPGGTRQAWYTQSLARIDEVLNVVNSTGKYWYQADALGSVYALTTSTGAVQARGGYDVFGAPQAVSGTAVGQPFGFTGREHEGDSGLVYSRARYLSPTTGRWERPDPLGMADGPNRFAYVAGVPTRRVDPRGLFATGIHETITREAFSGVLTGWELEVMLTAATVEADALLNQFSDYRHGMRAANQTIEEGARIWTKFIDQQLAMAVKRVDGQCAESRQWGLQLLGYGVHAVEDYYSPPHRMKVMDWSHLGAHGDAENHLTPESGPAREGYRAAREYALLFGWLRRAQTSWDQPAIEGIAWGFLGQMLFIDATTAE